jgi:MFS family permease
VLAPLGGLLADKVDRKKFLIALSVEQLVFSLGVALVVRGPSPSQVILVVMVVLVGVGNALYAPTYSAILPGLVGREDMPGAIALNSAQMNASRVIGPIIGSVAYHFVGPAWVFTGNAVTYLFVIAALMAVTLPALPKVARPAGPGHAEYGKWL